MERNQLACSHLCTNLEDVNHLVDFRKMNTNRYRIFRCLRELSTAHRSTSEWSLELCRGPQVRD